MGISPKDRVQRRSTSAYAQENIVIMLPPNTDPVERPQATAVPSDRLNLEGLFSRLSTEVNAIRIGSVTWVCGFGNARPRSQQRRREPADHPASRAYPRRSRVNRTMTRSRSTMCRWISIAASTSRSRGRQGCGKSTFLSILALLETPTSGLLVERPAHGPAHPAERARVRSLDVGLIFQSFNLIADMSVYENVEYPLTLRGKSAQERAERVHAALDRVGMTARAKQRPGQLSGGHQQLVAIARAIAGKPPILLADEPTGNLDSKTGDALMAMLSELHAGRGHRLPGDPQSRLHRPRRAAHLSVRREGDGGAGVVGATSCQLPAASSD